MSGAPPRRRRAKRSPIIVEVRPEPVHHVLTLASRLLVVDPDRFERVVALLEGYVSVYERTRDPEWSHEARRARVERGSGPAN